MTPELVPDAPGDGSPLASVVIPAHNEENVLGRCLATLLADTDDSELDVVVVVNGSTDATAEVARRFPGVRVIETEVANKAAALNLGDTAARTFPRFFVDADVEIEGRVVRTVARTMTSTGAPVAAPRLTWSEAGRSLAVRAYFMVWQQMPYGQNSLVGAGVYALSENGRARFESFPPIIADDLFIHRVFSDDERCTVADVTARIHPPQNLRSMLRMLTRQWVGNGQLERYLRVNGTPAHDARRRGVLRWLTSRLAAIATRPRLWPALPLHATIYVFVRVAGYIKLWRGDYSWARDDSSRTAR